MDINDLTKGVNQNNLNNTLKQFGNDNVERQMKPGGKHYKKHKSGAAETTAQQDRPERD